ncbi:RidA family protein [Pseudomonas fitomaticsae]|uniref:RidA family protein n=1 Tax=Pseudomonas fitomaticsae TaxID=2837969 RepID=A0ABY3PUF1_9PSED|nr:RidA family protein [Pseudomonas fitomaticsae]UFP97497.1 RidA family protein [Pseudomonas fitomaticsae]
MKFKRVYSGAPWERLAGYCRAVKAGKTILVGGTVAFGDDGEPFEPGDAYAQTLRCLEIIEQALKQLGEDRTRIIATRMYTTDMDLWPKIAQAHKKFFKKHRPTTMLLEVSRLIRSEYIIEIEAEARSSKSARHG